MILFAIKKVEISFITENCLFYMFSRQIKIRILIENIIKSFLNGIILKARFKTAKRITDARNGKKNL